MIMWAASCAASCCAFCACEACKGIAGGISKRSARLAYCGLFTLSLFLAWVLRDFAEPILSYIPWISHIDATKEFYGTQAVLRVSLGNFAFFAFFALLMAGVNDQRDQRDGWHHGGWMIKFILWCLIIIGAFFLPNSVVEAYGGASRFGSGFFLLVQVVILLDFTYNWNAAWVAKDEQKWYMAILAVCVACYVATFVFAGVLYHWFSPGGHDCQLNIFFITFSMLLSAVFSAVSLHPAVGGSLLPSSVITLYCMYLCYSALSSEPKNYECNGLARHMAAVSTGTLGMGMVTTLLAVVYSAVRAGSSSIAFAEPAEVAGEALLVKGGGREEMSAGEDSEDDMPLGGSRRKGSPKPVRYVYSFFHLIFALASMYSAMLLTGWGNSGIEGKDIIDVGWPSVYVKICSQWFTALLYLWSLVAPLVFPDRDFS